MRLIVVDDSLIVREGLQRLLECEGHVVVRTLDRADSVPAAVAMDEPDGVILDIRMPPSFTDEGIRLAGRLRAAHQELVLLVLSQDPVPEYATRLLEEGAATATGYLLKDRIFQPLQLSQALHRLSVGGTVVDADVVGELIASRRVQDALSVLSPRERDVIELMAEGFSDKGIAATLYVAPCTVETHVRHIFHKLNLPDAEVHNRRILAVLTYLQSASGGIQCSSPSIQGNP